MPMSPVRWLLAGLLGAAAPAASALCVLPLCTCSVAVTNVLFPLYNPILGVDADAVGNVRVDCGGIAGLLIPYTVSLAKGSGASYAARAMTSGAHALAYNLYTTSGRGTVWGDGTGGSQTVSGAFLLDALGLAPPQNNYVYGRIPAGQTSVVPAVYGDTITVTVSYQ